MPLVCIFLSAASPFKALIALLAEIILMAKSLGLRRIYGVGQENWRSSKKTSNKCINEIAERLDLRGWLRFTLRYPATFAALQKYWNLTPIYQELEFDRDLL